MARIGHSDGSAAAGAVVGRLNEFQRTMLQWSTLHPYNAVHVVRIDAPVDRVALSAAISHVLFEAGLTNYSLTEKGGYRYGGDRVDIEPLAIERGGELLADVHREMERQLNVEFPWRGEGTFQPFRWFFAREAGESFVGVAYFHVVADAESVGRLLREVLAACFDDSPRPLRDAALARRRSARVPMGGILAIPGRLAGAYRKFQRMRRSFRSPDCPVNEFRNEWFSRHLGEEDSAAVLALAKRHGATVNDLCLAALLMAEIPATSGRFEKKRQHLTAGCVVNLRRDLPEQRRRDFGLFLGSFSVTHPLPVSIRLGELLEGVHQQTEEVKRAKLYLASRLEFRLNRFLFARLPVEKQRNFYRKAFPAWGSITNFKMDEFYIGESATATDYHRAVSAGPALPFVVGVTGFGGRLNFGFTYRPDVIGVETVRGIADRFLAIVTGKGGAA